MTLPFLLTVLLTLQPTLATATQPSAPKFEDFTVNEDFAQKPAEVVLSNQRARMFRTMLRTIARSGPNFAGHFTVATWGCGTDCRQLAIIDAKTGTVHFDPNAQVIVGLPLQELDRVQFRKNSRLLVLAGMVDDRAAGTFYYEWDGQRLKLIHSDPEIH